MESEEGGEEEEEEKKRKKSYRFSCVIFRIIIKWEQTSSKTNKRERRRSWCLIL